MKKGLKKTIAIVGSVAGAIVLAIIILSFIMVTPLATFAKEAKSVSVIGGYNIGYRDDYDTQIHEKLDTVRFSVMRALIEFNADYSIKPVKDTVDDEEVNKKILSTSFVSNIRPATNQFFLEFTFVGLQTNEKFKDDEGNLIKYNRLILVINEAYDRLQPVTLYPYNEGNIGKVLLDDNGDAVQTPNENDEVDYRYYYIYEFSAKMYTAPLYEFINDANIVRR